MVKERFRRCLRNVFDEGLEICSNPDFEKLGDSFREGLKGFQVGGVAIYESIQPRLLIHSST
jgi:hypothetical protein